MAWPDGLYDLRLTEGLLSRFSANCGTIQPAGENRVEAWLQIELVNALRGG